MEEHHKEILRKNRIVLKRELSAERLASGLFAEKVFDQEDVSEIRAGTTPERQAETLLDLLVNRGPNAFHCFHQLLKNSSSHLAETLVPPRSERAVLDDLSLQAASLPCQQANFVGRTQLCRDLVSHINTGHRLIFMSAPPGYGKSASTITIGHMLKKEGFVVSYFLLKKITAVYDAAVLILETLGRVTSTNPVLQLHRLLQSIPNKTVLILDNTENVQEKENEQFIEFLDEIGKFAHNLYTLVTSTEVFSQPKLRPFPAKSIPLEPLNEDESLLLFKKYVTGMNISTMEEKDLCKACMGIPLFLEVAASQVKQGCDILALIQELKSKPETLLKEDDVYFKCMKVFLARLPESLKVVFAYLAVFPTNFTFDEAWFSMFFNQENINDFNLHSKIGKLMNYALLKFDEENKTYQLHSVVQSVCKSRIDDIIFQNYNQAVDKFIQSYLTFLKEINIQFISHESKLALERFSRNKRNILHAFSLAIEYEKEEAVDVSTECVNLLAKCLNIKEFEEIYLGFAKKARTKQNMKQYSDCLTSLGFKRLCYHGKDNSNEAFEVLFEANELQELNQFTDCEERAHCISKLGLCYVRSGDVERGVRMIVKGIILRKRLHARLGGAVREMLVCGGYCDLAMALSTINKFKAAVKIWETICLDGYRRILNNHPFCASLLQYIGDAYHKLEKYDQAEDYKRNALDMRKNLLTINHQDTARSFSSLAQTLEKLGKPEDAVDMLNTTLSIQSKSWASPEDICTTTKEIERIQKQTRHGADVWHRIGRCSILDNRMTSPSCFRGNSYIL